MHHPRRSTYATLLVSMGCVLVFLCFGTLVNPLRAASQSYTLTPGDQLVVSCSTRIRSSVKDGQATIICPQAQITPTASSQPSATTAPQPSATTAPQASATATSGQQTPVRGQLCPTWVHDSYVTTGPDGKQYPTWHPPVDEQYGCYFDHEHGDDPRTSVLFNEVGMPPFGYVNAVEGQRKEDHVGNKVYVVNNDGRGGILLVKLHQGTHSPDAFTNNLHELQYHYRNTDGRKLDVMILSAFGQSGQMIKGCGAASKQVVQTGAPTNDLGRNGGARIIPDASCFSPSSLPYEDWLSGNHITTANGRDVAYFDPHFAVFNPSRYYASEKPNTLGRSVELCQTLSGSLRYECQFVRDNRAITWDSPASTFKGEKREMYVNQNQLFNANGPNVWYCDPYGRNASTTPFPGAIKQNIASVQYAQTVSSLVFGANTNHNGPGVHSPN